LPRLLFLAHRIPYPPNKGDKVRSYNLLKHLAARYKVYLGAFVDDIADFQYASVLNEMCEECCFVGLKPGPAKLRSLTGFVTGEALTLRYYRSGRMQQWVDGVLQNASVNKILVFSSAMAQYVSEVKNARRVADLVDVDSDKWRQYSITQTWPYSAIYRRESRRLFEFERAIAVSFDATVFVSPAEAALFKQLAPETAHKVWHANNGVDSEYFSPHVKHENPYRADERVLVFTGAMDYWPNVDAVVRFANFVFPSILARHPDARFYIVGVRPTSDVVRLGELPGVRVSGSVPDIRPYLAHAHLAVAPLRIARGVQNKVLEAMAMGKTVIASPEAAEGIDAEIGKELIVAADDGHFISIIVRLMGSEVAQDLGVAARARVTCAYSWSGNLRHFDRLLKADSGSEPRDAPPGLPEPKVVSEMKEYS
jgi:sugar transferase (PEP-CTERM/EpsH1 system associated)